jgi:hypothetical protein
MYLSESSSCTWCHWAVSSCVAFEWCCWLWKPQLYLKRFKTSIVCNQSSNGFEITRENRHQGYDIVLLGQGYRKFQGLMIDRSEAVIELRLRKKTEENRSKFRITVTSSTKNLTWNRQGLNPDLHIHKSDPNSPSWTQPISELTTRKLHLDF